MQPSLDDSYLRIKRAHVHIRALGAMQYRIATVDPDSVSVEPHHSDDDIAPDSDGVVRLDLRNATAAEVEDGHRRLFRTPKFTPPAARPANPQWAIRLGEAIYNLRAALDYLVYSLSWLDSGGERNGTQFPTCSSPDDFKKSLKSGNLRGIKKHHRTVIQCMQPYPTRSGLDPLWLARLAEFSNPDKHRKLTAVLTRTKSTTVWTLSADPNKGVAVNYSASREITLGDAHKTPGIPALESLALHVTETLAEFAPCFKGKCPHK